MISAETIAICATVFFVAGLLELFSVPENVQEIRFARALCAFGFWVFGTRLSYLVITDDIVRLHFASMGALMAICIGRIIICDGILRKK